MAHAPPAKEKSKQIDNNERDEFPAPLDGGWGWVVVMASFLIHIVSKYKLNEHYFHNFINLDLFSLA